MLVLRWSVPHCKEAGRGEERNVMYGFDWQRFQLRVVAMQGRRE
jgi:hypothetical protein